MEQYHQASTEMIILFSEELSGIGRPGDGIVLAGTIYRPDTIKLLIWCNASVKHRIIRVGNIAHTLYIRGSIAEKAREITASE